MKAPLLAGLLASFAPPPVALASPETSAADRLLEEGIELARAGEYRDACARFTAALRLRRDVRGQGLEAGCYEKLGQLATAWRSYRRLRALADESGDAESGAFAAAGEARLEGRLAHLTIEVRGERDLVVSVDGDVWPRAEWGRPIPIDAGTHLIRGDRPGREPWQERVSIADGESVHRWIEPLPARRAPIAVGRPVRAAVGLSAAGAGALIAVVGGVVGLDAMRTWDDARAAGCRTDGRCPDARSLALAEVAGSKADTATWLVGSGLVVAAAGAILWFTGRDSPAAAADRDRVSVTPLGSPSAAGLGIEGSF